MVLHDQSKQILTVDSSCSNGDIDPNGDLVTNLHIIALHCLCLHYKSSFKKFMYSEGFYVEQNVVAEVPL